MLKKILILSATLALSTSCHIFIDPMPKSWGWSFRPLTGVRNFPSTDTEYGKGFKDGCHSGWDLAAKGLLSDYNQKRYDYKRMLKSGDYQTGWWDGYEQCTYIIDNDVV